MALANLNINVNANVSNVVNAMADVRAVTNASMIGSSAAVNNFQKDFARDAAAINAKSKEVGAEMGASSVAVTKAAQVSAESISGIAAAADASIAGVKELSRGLDAAGKEIKKAIGPEAAAQVKSVTDGLKDFVESRVAIAAVGVAFGAVAAGIAAAGFAAYHAAGIIKDTAGFMKGLIFTGESYKSANIDALIATNDKVIDLQKNLQLAAQDANAMNDALSRLGINKADITTVAGNVDNVIRGGNTSELDRLGVAWKDKDPSTIIANAKKVLDEYTEGWDRNSAAVALGLGSYDQMNNYLKVNQQELQNSKQRLDEYGLGIGPETQEAVKRYQAAILLFNNETRLMGEGFKRVVADNVMPILTNFAGYLKDGWPSVVNFFRGITAQFTSILLGLDSAAYIAIKGTIASLTSFVDVTEGIVLAIGKLATGDIKGAQDELKKGWSNAGKTMATAGDDMVKHAENTVKALKLAWAFDDRSNPLGMKPPKGKTFTKPTVDEEPAAVADQSDLWAKVHSKYLEYLKSYNATAAEMVKTAAAEQLLINQQSYEWGLVDFKTYLDTKRNYSERAVLDEIRLKKEEIQTYADEIAKYKGDTDAKGALAYTEALKKEQDAKTQLVTLEGKLGELRLKNNNEATKGDYQQAARFQNLAAQIMEITGCYEEAAEARAAFEKQSPEYTGASPAEQSLRDSLSQYSVSQARARALDNNVMRPSQNLRSVLGGENFGSQYADATAQFEKERQDLQAQYDAKLLMETEFNAKMIQAKELYSAQQTAINLSMAESVTGIMKQAFADSKEMQIAAMVIEKAIAIARIIMNTEVAASAVEGIPYVGAVQAAAVRARGYISIGMVAASGVIEGIQLAGQRADGGPVSGGATYLVGERGPELFTPKTSGAIIPNDRLTGGGVTIQQTFSITGVAADLTANMKTIAKQAGEEAKAAILNSMNRGGSYALASGRMR